MLSYQHIYHAGNKADLHKHALLARVLDEMVKCPDPVLYIETHAGRGLYDLRSNEAEKTGEARQGWISAAENPKKLAALPQSYVDAVRACNDGLLKPFYPGSPKIAAHILRSRDSLHLYDLHPGEFAALEKTMGRGPSILLEKRDGLEAVLAGAKLNAENYKSALILIDPSYEIKSEYEQIPAAIEKIHGLFPQAGILLWLPILPALRHEGAIAVMEKNHPDLKISQTIWGDPAAGRGLFGSMMLGVNIPGSLFAD